MKPGRQWPGVGVGAIVKHRDRLLMVRRDGAHGAGKWSVPGGWVEMWESPLQAAEREVLEETGLRVGALSGLGWSDSQHRDDGIHAVTLWVGCVYLSGKPSVVEPDKCPEVAWIPLTEVRNRPLFEPMDEWWTA